MIKLGIDWSWKGEFIKRQFIKRQFSSVERKPIWSALCKHKFTEILIEMSNFTTIVDKTTLLFAKQLTLNFGAW